MRFYAKQPNGLYCYVDNEDSKLFVTDMSEFKLEEEQSTHEGSLVSFNEVVGKLKEYYPYDDCTPICNELKNIGYKQWETFKPVITRLHDCVEDKPKEEVKDNAKYTFEYIKEHGLLLYEYIRGSQSQGLALPTSDVDTGGVFCMSYDDLMGMKSYQVENIKDEKGDAAWFEISTFIELLRKANPAALEALFVPEHCITYMHPAFKAIYDRRQEFVTKKCFKSFFAYGYQQVKRSRGLNKRINKPVTELLTVLSFCRTPMSQGSTPIEKFLSARGLKQRYVGLNKISHMELLRGAYYDYGTHLRVEYDADSFSKLYHRNDESFNAFMKFMYDNNVLTWKDRIRLFFSPHKYETILEIVQPKGYHGIMREDGKSNEIRLDSILKGDQPICYIEYNKDGYTLHCKEYKETQEWIMNRNQQRYLENAGKQFDRKNVEHSYRLVNMGIEIAKTGQVNVDRTNIDREFLLNIKLGNATYEELIAGLDDKMKEFNEAAANSTIQDDIPMSKDELNQILIDIREQFNDSKKETK